MRAFTLFITSLLLTSLVCAQQVIPHRRKNFQTVQSSGTTIASDYWLDFAFTAGANAITVAQITNANHYDDSIGTPSFSATTYGLSTSASGQQSWVGWPQGIQDTDTRGLAINLSTNETPYMSQPVPGSNTICFGFMVQCPAITSGNDHYFWRLVDGGANDMVEWRWRSVAGTTKMLTWIGGNYDQFDASSGTWYRCEGKYVKTGSCIMHIYSTGGTLLYGYTNSDTTGYTPAARRLGKTVNNHVEAANVSIYLDNEIMRWSGTPTLPIGP